MMIIILLQNNDDNSNNNNNNKNHDRNDNKNLFKSILSIVVPSAASPQIPEADPKTLLTTAVDCEASTSNTL